MNGEGQLEPSFGWRATHVMSLRGFQLFHLRSKRRRRLLLLPLFSLTFYTVTSFDRGWGREGERGRKKRKRKRLLVSAGESVQAPAVQSSLSSGDKATWFFFCVCVCQLPHSFLYVLDVFVIKVLIPVHGTLAFSQAVSPAQDRKDALVWPRAFGYSRLHGWSLPYFFSQSYCRWWGGMFGARSLTAAVFFFLLCLKV